MKIVVDIPEEHLKTLRQLSGLGYYHEVIVKGQPLSEILDKISAEIERLDTESWELSVTDVLNVIDRYREGDKE